MQKGTRTRLPRLRALVVAVHAAWSGLALALPQDANVVNGQVAITQPAAGTMHINASNGAIINWRQFSIGAGETTRFIQPSAGSAVLNRVTGTDASLLLGQLQANGQVFLINPAGIVIGGGARIDTNSFIASTLDIRDADFLAGKLRFFDSGKAGSIQNAGMVTTTPGGRVVLIAPDIQNSGIIHAPDGKILLAAGRKLEIASLDLDGIRFEIQAPTDSVLNLGQLLADNGAVQAFASTLRQSGVVRADRLAVDADGSIVLAGRDELSLTAGSVTQSRGANGLAGGDIVLQSTDGTTRVAGTVAAQGLTGAGGDIRVLGDRVALQAGAVLDASGSTGGGQILVGGDYQGANAGVQNALRVTVAEGAQLRADATAQGDGGRVIVWADENTRFHGTLSARGAGAGGDGGFAEVSGKQNLEFLGKADLGADQGQRGTLLLDPLDIIISATSGILPSVVDDFDDFRHNVVTISPVTLAAMEADVMLQAHRDIHVKDALTLSKAGASVTMLAGGAAFDAGGIYNDAGITTVGGAVTLRGQFITGGGGITTAGGAVDLQATGALTYSAPITTSGGSVTLRSLGFDEGGGVDNVHVDAGSGNITVNSAAGIYGGSYTTTGTVSFQAPDGSIHLGDVRAARVALDARYSIDASLDVSERVDAVSQDGTVQISNAGASVLPLGTISAPDGIYLYAGPGLGMAAGGLLSTPYLYVNLDSSTLFAGSANSPLRIGALAGSPDPRVQIYGVDVPVHLAFAAGTQVGGLMLDGSVAGLGGSSIAGGDNLAGFSLSASSGVVVLSASTTGGLAQGLEINVRDTGLHVTSLALPGASAELTAAGGITVESMTGGSLYVYAQGGITIGAAETTGSGGIYASVNQCQYSYYSGCAAASPITAGSLTTTGGGDIGLYTYDNGAITVTSITSSGDVRLEAGRIYQTTPGYPYTSEATTNGISVGSLTAAASATLRNVGNGNIAVSDLQVANYVQVEAGDTYSPSYNTYVTTTNDISLNVTGTAVAGSFNVDNQGSGNVMLSGVVDRSLAGSISVSAVDGSIMASGNLLARDAVNVTAYLGAVSLADVTSANRSISVTAGTSLLAGALQAGNVSSTSAFVNLGSGTDLRFASIASTGASSSYGSVTLESAAGTIGTTLDNTGWDILATGNVTLRTHDSVAGAIGNAAFANPLDIRAGANAVVTLAAGASIGSATNVVRVDTGGTIDVASAGGQFHVAATDGTAERSVASIRLAASAAGVGQGNTATFTSANLDVTASSDGAALTLGDLLQSSGTLNEFSFSASGSGLQFGDVNLASGGINKLVLASDGLMRQTSGNILAGNLSLDAGSGDVEVDGNITSSSAVVASPARNNILAIRGVNITTGDLTAQSVKVNGSGNVSVGTVQSLGTQRGSGNSSYDYSAPPSGMYPLDELHLIAGGDIQTTGNVSSATSAFLTAGGSVTLAGGSGTATAGSFSNSNYVDRLELKAGTAPGGTVAAGNLSGRNITLQGHDVDVGSIAANTNVLITGTDLSTGTITAGNNVSMTGTSLTTGAITAPTVSLQAMDFDVGNLTASSSLNITALGDFTPAGFSMQAGYTSIGAAGSIAILANNGVSLTSPNVSLTAGGNMVAELTGTSNLTIQAGMGFDVVTDTWMTVLNVTAYWDAATGMDSVGAQVRSVTSATSPGSTQRFGYGFDGALLMNIYSDASQAAGRTWNFSYNDYSGAAVAASSTPSSSDMVELSISHLGHGNVSIYFASDTVIGQTQASVGDSASGSSSTLYLETGGRVVLDSVSTHRGNLSVWSRGGDVLVGSINTSFANGGGSVDLRAGGSIETDGSPYAGIEAAQLGGGPLPSGDVSLAAGSNIGALGAIPVAYADFLTLSAPDTIAVNVAAGDLFGLYVTTSGSGSGSIQIDNGNFAGLSITRDAGNLRLGSVAPLTVADFQLMSTSGSIVVDGDITNVGSLRLDTSSASDADILIQAGSGPRTVSANYLEFLASRDVVIAAGSAAGSHVSVDALNTFSTSTISAGRDLLVTADGGSASVSKASSSGYTQYLYVGRDLRVTGGSAGEAGATASISTTGNQYFNVGNDFVVQAGSSDGASASVTAAGSQSAGGLRNLRVRGGGDNAQAVLEAGTSQGFGSVTGEVVVAGGTGVGAAARIEALGSSQTIGDYYSSSPTLIRVEGGTGTNASAAIRALQAQSIYGNGDIQVVGGAGVGANALIRSVNASQNIGSNYISGVYYADGISTRDILVQGGAGGTAGILAQTSQTLYAGGLISVLGGTGADTTATITSTAGNQTIGLTSTFNYDPTGDILVQGGSGTGASASIVAQGSQNIQTGGDLSVLGGGGDGALAEIRSANSSQQIGNTSTSGNDATGNMVVRGGSGAGSLARIQAQSGQTLRMGGEFVVEGGGGSGTTAAVETAAGFQTIGQITGFSNDSTGSMGVRGGSGAGAAAWVRGGGGQTLNIGNLVMVEGGSGSDAFAEVAATGTGTQTLNNNAGGDGNSRGILLRGGGQAGSYAMLRGNGFQQINTSGDMVLQGGTGDGAGAVVQANTGQTVTVGGALRITGGTGSTPGGNVSGIDNLVSGSQTLYVSGDIVLTAGGAGSDTGIVHQGPGLQYITSYDGSLSLEAGASAGADAALFLEAGMGGQTLYFYNGSISVNNAGALQARIWSEGDQNLVAQSLAITLSSASNIDGVGASAVVGGGGNVSLDLRGDGSTAGSATLSVVNRSGAAGSLAALQSGGDLDIQMDYDTAGAVQIGAADALGRSVVSAAKQLTLVAGSLRMQGGAVAGADAQLLSAQDDPAVGIMVLSTINGPVEMLGGAGGGAFIDPPELYIASNGSVLMTAGSGPESDVTIVAGLFDLTATGGDLVLTNSSISPAIASITAGTFHYFGSGSVNLAGGTIMVTDQGTIATTGACINCNSVHLIPFGNFTVQGYVPPVDPPPVEPPPLGVSDEYDVVSESIDAQLSLVDNNTGLFQVMQDDNGNLVLSRRRLNQCN